MTDIGIREARVSETILNQFDLPRHSPLWEAYRDAFQAMFSERGPAYGRTETEAIRLYRPEGERGDWSWYVSQRLGPSGVMRTHETEADLYRRLYGTGRQRLVYLHGHTGVGKTTLLQYFFSEFIPHVMPKEDRTLDLARFIPTNIPLAYVTTANLEEQWDFRVYEYLYREFKPLTNLRFLRNVARHMAYPDGEGRTLRLDDSGDLKPIGHDEKFATDTETQIETLVNVDRKSVIDWLRAKIAVVEGLTLGQLFNQSVVQVLAKHYGYRFTFVVDNIDDLPSDIQEMVCRLIVAKLRAYAPYETISFVVATRESFLEPVRSQTYQASQDFHHSELGLHPLPFSAVLHARKRSLFDPQVKDRTAWIRLMAGAHTEVADFDGFLESVFDAFDNVTKLTELYKLANHNTRTMLDVVETLFSSPHLDARLLQDVVTAATRAGKTLRNSVTEGFLSTNRIVDVVVRGQNQLLAPVETSRVPNIYYSGSADHYSSTLCRLLVMAVVIAEDQVSYGHLESVLSSLGHEVSVIEHAVQDLLEMKLVFCTRGYSLSKNPAERALQPLEDRGLPLARYLLTDLGCSLRYLQGMAYVTPMVDQYLDLFAVPEIGRPVDDFGQRLLAASALYKQIRTDALTQIAYVRASKDAERLSRIVARYGFCKYIDRIRSTVIAQFMGLPSTIRQDLNIYALFPLVNWQSE